MRTPPHPGRGASDRPAQRHNVYDPARDSEARIRLSSLAGAFDVLIHVHEASPVGWLPEFDAT
jgi:erythromycin esterase